MLAGVGSLVNKQLNQTKIAQTIGRENIFTRTEKIGEAGIEAWDAAQKWLDDQKRLEALAEPPEEETPEEPAKSDGQKKFFKSAGKVGASVVESWDTARRWVVERREDAAETPSAETQDNPDEEEKPR